MDAKAHVLKAECLDLAGQYEEERASLERAKALRTDDPWLLMGYGRYYNTQNRPDEAAAMFAQVEKRGPGSTASDQKAYVTALSKLTVFRFGDAKGKELLKKNAALALKARHPADAWTPHDFAQKFPWTELYDEAVEYSRIAETVNFGAGRHLLPRWQRCCKISSP